jgi:hypothetical protein
MNSNRLLSMLFLLLGVASCSSSFRNSTDFGESTDTAVRPPRCGDFICNGDETCLTCEQDCGECPKCTGAPSCTDAIGVPVNPVHRVDLDLGEPVSKSDAGVSSSDGAVSMSDRGVLFLDAGLPSDSNCKDPQLRLRIEKATVIKNGGQLYCVISASDGKTSEVAITTKTKTLADKESNFFDPGIAIFWGQSALAKTTNNLTITYDCWKVNSDAWSKVLKAVSDAANTAGGIPSPYGWAFGVGAVAASAAAAGAAAASGDDHRLNAQQNIDRHMLLDLTNGRTWRVRQTGSCGVLCNWDWELTIQSWGCAEAIPAPDHR